MIGGDIVISQIKLRDVHTGPSALLFHKESKEHGLSFFTMFMLLCKAAISTDPFLFGEVFRCGSVSSIFYDVILVLITELSLYLFIKSWIYGRAYTYESIWTELFGSTFSWFITLIVALAYMSYIVWFQYELYSYFIQFVSSLWDNPPSLLTSHYLVSYVLSAVFLIPPLFAQKLTGIFVISIISNVCQILGFICLIVFFCRNDHLDPNDTISVSNDISAHFNSIGLFNSALFIHPILAALIKEMEHPTQGNVMKLTWAISITSGILHFIIGFFSYLIAPDSNGDVVFNYLDPNQPEVILGKVITYIISITSNIFYIIYLSRQLAELFLVGSSRHFLPNFICGVVAILLAIGLNSIDKFFTTLFNYVSNVCTAILVFILPPLYYLREYRFTHFFWSVMSVILIVIGVPLCILSIYYAIAQ